MKLTRDCLVETLQNLSGKSIPADRLAKCETTSEVLDAFNELYACIVTFKGMADGQLVPANMMNITVKDKDGNEINHTADSNAIFALKEGDYTYSATLEGCVPQTDVSLKITNADKTSGTKQVTITFTAAA